MHFGPPGYGDRSPLDWGREYAMGNNDPDGVWQWAGGGDTCGEALWVEWSNRLSQALLSIAGAKPLAQGTCGLNPQLLECSKG